MAVWGVIGPPASEPKLLATLLAKQLRVPMVSINALAATEIRHRTHLGIQLSAAMQDSRGEMLPMRLVAPLLLQGIQAARQSTQSAGVVIAGAPRTREQYQLLVNAGHPVQILHLELNNARQQHRLSCRSAAMHMWQDCIIIALHASNSQPIGTRRPPQ